MTEGCLRRLHYGDGTVLEEGVDGNVKDVTGSPTDDRCTPMNLNLTDCNLFYSLSQGVSVLGVKFTCYRWLPTTDTTSRHVYVL